jgi:hypothetical protein
VSSCSEHDGIVALAMLPSDWCGRAVLFCAALRQMWRPSRRTSLSAFVGRRYDSMTYYGSFSYAPNTRNSLNIDAFDSVTGFGSTVGNALGLTLQIGYLSANVERLKFDNEAAALTNAGIQFDVRAGGLLFAAEGGAAAAQFFGEDEESIGESIGESDTTDTDLADETAVRRGPYGAMQVGLCTHGGEVTSDLFLRYEFQSLKGGGLTQKFDVIVVGAAVTFRSMMKGTLDSVFGG